MQTESTESCSKSILVFDPGDHTGWAYRRGDGSLEVGTSVRNHLEVEQIIQERMPDIIVYENFKLYPQMAKSLAWNSFYPCEVIGVIRVAAMRWDIPIVDQAPSVKKYYGGAGADWEIARVSCPTCTEHSKDAYMHLRYFERNGLKRFK